jgi:hypothetical protein
LQTATLPFVLALKPSSASWAPAEAAHTPKEAAEALTWTSPEAPGDWLSVTRTFRGGRTEQWWTAELRYGPYGPDKALRVVVATTDPATLPDLTTWYLLTNLPAPGSPEADDLPFPPADLAELVRLYGLRNWIEQSYKQVKDELGWADFMVRADAAIRRHWTLVWCAFAFCWRHGLAESPPVTRPTEPSTDVCSSGPAEQPAWSDAPLSGEKREAGAGSTGGGRPHDLAGNAAAGAELARPLEFSRTLLARVVQCAPAARTPATPRFTQQWPPTSPVSPLLTNYR